ncbi:OmpH family outer membrane protein [Algibacter amylolyticus]|uniref:OmpH family outer membrane protein n=1 Tax=Algibacter amylolyticus TaxID=1608400 RepID=A0A5M7BCL6_9FLAO|nr:OmpH family outer membrane protein [Algibacter amylolyticus]KAA5827436.1 OmpH family outer membrane protein [Algibacter amylolyticus]MBB5266629.1 outer membrane protein [Algibacter amylolyticus]TSJ81681.1 OmpH family outer membrane protein [Algibacter amylolyticus]
MKNIIYVALVMLVLASCEKPNKIAFVDNGELINDYQEKKDVEAAFQIKDDAFRKRADSISQAFQAEAQKGQAEAQRLARSNRKKAEELMTGLQQKQQQLQQQMQIEQQKLTQEFQAEIDSVIVHVKDFVKDYGKTNGYNYILGTSDAAATVMYGAEQSDLTQTILDALNADYKKE